MKYPVLPVNQISKSQLGSSELDIKSIDDFIMQGCSRPWPNVGDKLHLQKSSAGTYNMAAKVSVSIIVRSFLSSRLE